MGSSPTAPTTYCLRARIPQGCGLVSFGRRWGSNPRGGERQADAQRPQRAGEGAGRRPKPVRICTANTQTSHRPYHVLFTSPCPPGMRARFFRTPVGLEPARGRASSGRAASAASRRGRRQATEAGAYLHSKYADVPPPLPRIVYEPVSPRDAGSFLLDASTDGELRWNSSCLCRLPAYLGTISPQIRLILAHFSMEKRVCLPHFSIEKCGCLAHFPREMRLWPYTIRKGWEAICSDSL